MKHKVTLYKMKSPWGTELVCTIKPEGYVLIDKVEIEVEFPRERNVREAFEKAIEEEKILSARRIAGYKSQMEKI